MKLPGILVKFRPAGPWRFGPDNGARDRAEVVGHSDTVYAAVCSAMLHLGQLDAWLDATARAAEPAVRFSSLFPFHGRTLFAPPPQHLWPPALAQRLRFRSARFAPLALIQDLVLDQPLREERWEVDGQSGCVIHSGGQSPFRETLRSAAAVDRLTGASAAHQTACIEFNQNAGLWLAVEFATAADAATWRGPVQSALRWLGDSGFGGERSRGWGRSEEIEFQSGYFPDLLMPQTGDPSPQQTGYWLLSLYSPADSDTVDWDRGDYRLLVRNGRVDSGGSLKRSLRMIAEGSVVLAGAPPRGMAHDVAPEGFAHPVYRAGSPIAIALPWKAAEDRPLAPLVEVRVAAPVVPVEAAPVEPPAVEDTTVQDSAVEAAAVHDTAAQDKAVPDTAVEYSSEPAIEVVPEDIELDTPPAAPPEKNIEGEGI